MDIGDTELEVGARVRLSVLGKARCPKMKTDTGVIVGGPIGRGVRILFDGSKTPITMHKSYVEPQ